MHSDPHILSVASSPRHAFSKQTSGSITLLAGLGVEGDAHCGPTVQHVYDKRHDATRPNLRQVHLLQIELLEEVAGLGFSVAPGEMGENVTTCGLDLLNLPRGTRLKLGETAIVEVTGLRSPCKQIERFRPGLMELVTDRTGPKPLGRTGVMSIVIEGGVVRAGDAIAVELPTGPHERLAAV